MAFITTIVQVDNVSFEQCGKVIVAQEHDDEGLKCIHVATHQDEGNSIHNIVFAKSEWVDD